MFNWLFGMFKKAEKKNSNRYASLYDNDDTLRESIQDKIKDLTGKKKKPEFKIDEIKDPDIVEYYESDVSDDLINELSEQLIMLEAYEHIDLDDDEEIDIIHINPPKEDQ